MDEYITGLVEAGIYTLGATIGAISIAYIGAKHWYLKRKSDNETQPEKIRAFRELIESPDFQRYIQQRQDYLREVMLPSNRWEDPAAIEKLVNTAMGELRLPKLDENREV